jgi:hypothetical protein
MRSMEIPMPRYLKSAMNARAANSYISTQLPKFELDVLSRGRDYGICSVGKNNNLPMIGTPELTECRGDWLRYVICRETDWQAA